MKKSPNGTSRMEKVAPACTSIGFLFLSGGVIACIFCLLLTMASLVLARPAAAQSAPVAAGVRLEAGIEKEDVDGDLKSAMDIYQKIAADKSAARDVRAKALLRLAGCDEKLGKQAKQVYEQIVHDYADMPAAAQARKRLAMLKQQENPATPTTMNVRKIEWAGLGEMSPCDTDGHRAVFRAADGNLYFGDLTGQNKRLVFKVQPGDVPVWCASRDLSMTALVFSPKPNRPAIIAVVKTDGTGYRELIQDDVQGTVLGGVSDFDIDWSWDTRHLLVSGDLPNGGSHLMIVDLADGHQRELVHLPSAALRHAVFSPDGNSIAYMAFSGPGLGVAMRIFVMATEGAEARQVYQAPLNNDEGTQINSQQRLHDWTADGRYLLISDVHFRKVGLYLLPLKDGAAAGNPVFVREGENEDAHTTASGTLIFKDRPAHSHEFSAFLATLDPDGKLGAWQRLEIRGGNSDWFPGVSFSPDGAQIAYVSGDEEKGGRDLVLRKLSTGQEQVLHWFNSGRPDCRFAFALPKLFCFVGWDDNGGHSNLVSVATESGALEELASFSDYRGRIIPSTDDQRIYLMAMKAFLGGHFGIWETKGRQDTVIDSIARELNQFYVPTQDERWLIRVDLHGLALRPMSGGDWKYLVSASTGPVTEPQDAVTHGDWVLFDAKDSDGKIRLYRIPISGGEPQFIGDFPVDRKSEEGGPYLQLSRDARQVIAQIEDESKFNLWTLDNFEPADKK
jgi:Tol biopolymer transport system component